MLYLLSLGVSPYHIVKLAEAMDESVSEKDTLDSSKKKEEDSSYD